MTVQTYTIIAGTEACNARCPFCVAKMTPTHDLGMKLQEVNWRNFDIGAKYSRQNGASTTLITGKGEPTLFPDQITEYMEHLKPHDFPFIEIQTNGIMIEKNPEKYDKYLKRWYELGMTTIAISIVSTEPEKNRQIYTPYAKEYINLDSLIDRLHGYGFSVRLSCMMTKGNTDSLEGIEKLVDYAIKHNVEQITATPINAPNESINDEVKKWTDDHKIPQSEIDNIREHLDSKGNRLRELVHGAIVYDYKGQNICLSNCLTIDAKKDEIRQVIFFPDGHVRYDWQYKGALMV